MDLLVHEQASLFSQAGLRAHVPGIAMAISRCFGVLKPMCYLACVLSLIAAEEAVARDVRPQEHLFYRDAQGAIHHVFWSSAQNFDHDIWTAEVGGPPAASNPAAMVADGQQHVFYRDAAGGIQHIYWSENHGFESNTWLDPEQKERPAPLAAAPLAAGDPAAIFASGQQHVFYRDADGGIRHIYWSEGHDFRYDTWLHPEQKERPAPLAAAPLAAGDPAAMATIDPLQHVFYRDAADAIQHIYWSQSSGFFRNEWPVWGDSPPQGGMAAMGTWLVVERPHGTCPPCEDEVNLLLGTACVWNVFKCGFKETRHEYCVFRATQPPKTIPECTRCSSLFDGDAGRSDCIVRNPGGLTAKFGKCPVNDCMIVPTASR